jgi:hypothetical protein
MSFNECTNLINSIHDSKNTNENFFNYVYKKIARNTKNRFVEKYDDCIDIVLSNHPSIKVIPLCTNMNKKSLSIKNEVKMACDIVLNSEYKYVYFVYPKNRNFNKHIQVKIPLLEESGDEYMVKLIPYSLNDIIKKRGCSENSNILCK